MPRLEMTREVLSQYFNYDHADGQLYWNQDRPRDGMRPQAYGAWRSSSAGKLAGTVSSRGQRVVRLSGHTYQVARIVIALVNGRIGAKDEVSFKNGDQADTRIDNLVLTKASVRAKSKRVPVPKGLVGRDLKREFFEPHLSLDETTGKLYWRDDAPHGYRSHANHLAWLKRFGGKEAGSVNKVGYRMISLLGSFYLNHRVVAAMIHGVVPGNMDVDHIDGNKLNNRPDNLRVVTHSLNNRNHKLFSSNTSGHNGVYQRRDTGKWVAFHGLEQDGKRKVRVLGGFDSIEDAIAERRAWERANGFTDRHTW